MAKLLSIIIPVLKPNNYLSDLLQSINSFCNDDKFEVIIINQTGKSLEKSFREKFQGFLIDHVIDEPIPAASARNIGGALADGEYLFFLDDDAVVLYDESILGALEQILFKGIYDLVIFQRGELIEGIYHSHWGVGIDKIDYKNFPRLTIEWNLVVKRNIFLKLGCFPQIGAGSSHAALSGEAFVLVSRALAANLAISLYPEIKVAHPNLFSKPKNTEVALGYAYGAGYAVGISQKYFPFKIRMYWIIRVIFSSLIRMLFDNKDRISPIENINSKKYRFVLAKMKLRGFMDSIIIGTPRTRSWLNIEAKRILKFAN